MRTLIIGCGYVGMPLGVALAELGHQVFGVRRSPGAKEEMKTRGIEPVLSDITKEIDVECLPGRIDWIVNVASTGRSGAGEYRNTFLNGTRNVIQRFIAEEPAKYVYTSSIGVYHQTDGSVVDESSLTDPSHETGQVLIETERLLSDAWQSNAFPAIILRAAGIYGPGRGFWFRQFLKGEARIMGEGRRILNMIHRDDLIGIIMAALQRGQPGEVYNAVDNEPVAESEFFAWLSEKTGKAMPPQGDGSTSRTRRRGLTNKKVSNRKLVERLNYTFKYPTFREGFSVEISRSMNGDSVL